MARCESDTTPASSFALGVADQTSPVALLARSQVAFFVRMPLGTVRLGPSLRHYPLPTEPPVLRSGAEHEVGRLDTAPVWACRSSGAIAVVVTGVVDGLTRWHLHYQT